MKPRIALILAVLLLASLACSLGTTVVVTATPAPTAASAATMAPQSTEPPPATQPPAATQAGPTPAGSSQEVPHPSGLISQVVLAEDAQGENMDPVNPTTAFSPDATIHAVVEIQDAPANTSFKVVWYAEDIGSGSPPHSLIDQYELTSDGTRNLDFSLSPNTSWPVGTYEAEIYVNGALDQVAVFTVR